MLDTKWTTQLEGHWVGESSLSIDLVYCGHQEAGRHVYVKSFHTWPSGGGRGGECDIHCVVEDWGILS